MTLSHQIAKHFREVYFGGNWTTVNFKTTLADVTWQQAVQKNTNFSRIVTLTFHATYYTTALLNVLEGKPLDAKDEYSFLHPTITCQDDWQNLLTNAYSTAEATATLIDQMPEHLFFENFTNEKYGTYYRNITGTIEHLHYHLGQIVFCKKMLLS
jgi:hypothetical protein